MATLYDPDVPGICERILRDLRDMAQPNAPETAVHMNGTLNAMLSPYNNRSAWEPLGVNDGTVRQMRIKYLRRGIVDDVLEDFADIECGIGTDPAYTEITMEITEEIAMPAITISEMDMKKLCMTGADYEGWRDRVLLTNMDALRTKLSRNILQKIALNCIGVNINNVETGAPSPNPKNINVLTGDCNAVCADGISELLIDYEDNQLNGAPIIIGQGNWQKAMMGLDWGCCNTSGIDMNKVRASINAHQSAWFKDTGSNAILGQDNILVLAPGAVQFIPWNPFKGMEKAWNGNFAHLTLPDPVFPGLKWAWHIKYTDCTDDTGLGTYWMNLKAMWDVFCIPGDAFQAGDDIFGMTGAMIYHAQAAS